MKYLPDVATCMPGGSGTGSGTSRFGSRSGSRFGSRSGGLFELHAYTQVTG